MYLAAFVTVTLTLVASCAPSVTTKALALPLLSARDNEMIYKVLCREAHARPRFESFRIDHDPTQGAVRFYSPPRNPEQVRRAVTGGTELSIGETVAALRWRRTGVAYAGEDDRPSGGLRST